MIPNELIPEGMSIKDFIKTITLEEDVDGIKGQLRLALPFSDNLLYRIVEKGENVILQAKNRK